MDPILTYLEEHREAIVEDLRAFVERESPSTEKPLLDAWANFAAEYARALGGRPKLVEHETYGNHLCVEWPGSGGERPILLVGHYDTVWPSGTLQRLPFRNEDGVVRGPGIFDMKAGLVQGLWALRALRHTGTLDRPVTFIFNSDEELGSPSSRPLIEDAARNAAAVFVLEPSQDGALKTARKGVGIFEVEIEGRPAHAGIDPTAGISAVEELGHVILQLHALTDLAKGTTVNVGVVQGGTRRNVVAEHAGALIDLRVATAAEAERVSAAILGLKPHVAGAKITVKGGLNRPPMERSAATGSLFARAKSLAAEDLGFELKETATGGGSDGNFCAAVGAAVLDGLGPVGGGAHAASEHVLAAQMPQRAALVAKLIQSLPRAATPA